MHTVTFATYNIRHGHDVAFDFDKLSESIRQVAPQVVGVQEIDVGTNRSHGLDTLSALQTATGMPYAVFAPTMDYDGGQYGIGMLSVYPIKDIKIIPLPTPEGYEPRCALRCILSTEQGEMVFVNTHLSYEATHLRAPQFDLLATWLPADKPYVVMGDFNTEDQGEFSVLTDMGAVMVNTGDRLCKTFRQPPTAIDHILYHPQSMILVDSGMVDRPHSDHNLFYATFQINYPHP